MASRKHDRHSLDDPIGNPFTDLDGIELVEDNIFSFGGNNYQLNQIVSTFPSPKDQRPSVDSRYPEESSIGRKNSRSTEFTYTPASSGSFRSLDPSRSIYDLASSRWPKGPGSSISGYSSASSRFSQGTSSSISSCTSASWDLGSSELASSNFFKGPNDSVSRDSSTSSGFLPGSSSSRESSTSSGFFPGSGSSRDSSVSSGFSTGPQIPLASESIPKIWPCSSEDDNKTSYGVPDYKTYTDLLSNRPTGSEHQRVTPSSLNWHPYTELWKLYSFTLEVGKEPYLQLLPGFSPTLLTPRRVDLDRTLGSFSCVFPGSCGREFKKAADLQTHYQNVHTASKRRTLLVCSYDNCKYPKLGHEFAQKSHLRDHYREVHKEDVWPAEAVTGGERFNSRENTYFRSRNWWRCPMDLMKVYINESGWKCASCGVACAPDRIVAREPQRPSLASRHSGEDNNDGPRDSAQYSSVPKPESRLTSNHPKQDLIATRKPEINASKDAEK